MLLSRRMLLAAGTAGLAAGRNPALAADALSDGVAPELLRRAMDAFKRHQASIPNRDIVAIADFSLPSRQPRFHLLDIASGRVNSCLVAHGRGSDPGHTGWLERFSNAFGSYATSAGAYRTDGLYIGAHGRSLRLTGLDASNDNALGRGIVVHGAWYVNEDMARQHGVLGRSEGCFALSGASLEEVVTRLGTGRLIYADKI